MGVLDALNFGLKAGSEVLNQVNMRKQWQREDNAVQRRVVDLKKAGLSPTLAAGSAASTSAPIRINAPEYTKDVEAQNAGIAQTKAQTDLNKIQWDVLRANNLESMNRMYVLNKDAEYGGEMSRNLALSQIGRATAENNEFVRNIQMFRDYGLPSMSGPGAEMLASESMIKKMFPQMKEGSYATTTLLMRLLQSIAGGR